jgi:rfaE bifunctional protein nucleotidyltransferase chain/domain
MTSGPERATALADLLADRRRWAAEGRQVVLTNGCFDLLHPGHVTLLEAARGEGDRLVVAINSDRSVREIKGKGRPLNPEAERAEALLALECVDRVIIYDEPTPSAIIDALAPDVLVKGADWALAEIVGRETVTGRGGRVVRVPLVAGQSTTAVVDRIRRP